MLTIHITDAHYKMHHMAVCLMFFLKYRKGEYDDEMSLLGLLGISAQIRIKNQQAKIWFYIEILFQGHIGIIGSRGAVGPQGPPVRQWNACSTDTILSFIETYQVYMFYL